MRIIPALKVQPLRVFQPERYVEHRYQTLAEAKIAINPRNIGWGEVHLVQLNESASLLDIMKAMKPRGTNTQVSALTEDLKDGKGVRTFSVSKVFAF